MINKFEKLFLLTFNCKSMLDLNILLIVEDPDEDQFTKTNTKIMKKMLEAIL
jgi:hypothetical protein